MLTSYHLLENICMSEVQRKMKYWIKKNSNIILNFKKLITIVKYCIGCPRGC